MKNPRKEYVSWNELELSGTSWNEKDSASNRHKKTKKLIERNCTCNTITQ